MDAELIMEALFAQTEGLVWDTPARGFQARSRRVKMWADAPTQPALYQVEHDEFAAKKRGLPYKWEMEAEWVVYQNVAKDAEALGQRENNLILNALRGKLRPEPGIKRCTLGGLVYDAFFDGRVFKDSGDLDGQGVIVMPIKILVP